MPRRRREDWEQLVEAYRASSLTRRAFASTTGISTETLRRWLKLASDAPRLLPVRVTAPPVPVIDAVTIALPEAVAIRVPVGVDPAYVAALVRALA